MSRQIINFPRYRMVVPRFKSLLRARLRLMLEPQLQSHLSKGLSACSLPACLASQPVWPFCPCSAPCPLQAYRKVLGSNPFYGQAAPYCRAPVTTVFTQQSLVQFHSILRFWRSLYPPQTPFCQLVSMAKMVEYMARDSEVAGSNPVRAKVVFFKF